MDNNDGKNDLAYNIEITENSFKVPLSKGEVNKQQKSNESKPQEDNKINNIPENIKNKLTEIEKVEYGKKSHLEFLKIIRENKDPINVMGRGGLKPYKMEEIQKHNTEDSLWMVLDGKVYDLTLYLDYHPGGRKKLFSGAGKDATMLFSKNEFK
jgi:cytochrome b involved in lipid metabolism